MEKHMHWLLRLPFAATLGFHGFEKFTNMAGAAEMFSLPVTIMTIVAIAEVLAAIGAIAGGISFLPFNDFVTRLAGFAALPVLVGAIFMVHFPRFSFAPTEQFPMGGFEFQLLLLCLSVYFVVMGQAEEDS